MLRSLVLICLSASRVAAQPAPEQPRPDRVSVGLGGVLGGGGPSNWFYGAWIADLGVTVVHESSQMPVRLRARLLAVLIGGTIESDWGGDLSRVGAGVEARSCSRSGGLCGFLDLDAGHQKLTLRDDGGELVRVDRGLFVGPRGGFEVGGALRFRVAIELYRQFTDRDMIGTFGTFGISLGLAYQR